MHEAQHDAPHETRTLYNRPAVPVGFLEVNQLFAGDFRVVRQLGEGGMGAVYIVEQLSTGRQRALKLMLARIAANPKSRARFIQEAQIGARVASEHVVQVITAGVDEATGTPYLVMELLDGEDLATFVDRTGPMAPATMLHVFGEISHAVAAAHRAAIVHRDLKPQNVFLARTMRSDGAVSVKVLDFGIAKLLDDERGSRTTQAVGSPLWLAPEQAGVDDPIVPSTDVWSLGLMAFWMLSGKLYWRAANKSGGPGSISVEQLLTEVLVAPIEEPRRRAEDYGAFDKIPEWISTWFTTAVARKQSQRFADAEAAFVALQEAARAAGVKARPLDAATLGTPPAIPIRSLPPVGDTPATSPERPGATSDTERDPRHPVDTAPQRPAALHGGETRSLQGVPGVPTTRESLGQAAATDSSPAVHVEKSFRTVALPAESGPISTPAIPATRSLTPPLAPPARKSSMMLRCAGVVGVVGVLCIGACVALGYSDFMAGLDEPGAAFADAAVTTVIAPIAPPPMPPAVTSEVGEHERTESITANAASLTPMAGVRPMPSSMIRFAGATFRMGSTDEEIATERAACLAEGNDDDCPPEMFAHERPSRTVTIGPFAIDRAEVTNSAYAEWLADERNAQIRERNLYGERLAMVSSRGEVLVAVYRPGGSEHVGLVESNGTITVRPGFERRPVVYVTWAAANLYCRDRRRRLPTEAQWELAAGAGSRRYTVANEPPQCAAVTRGRYDQGPCASEPRGTTPVRSAPGDVTPEGVHDLAGNVAEWVDDVMSGPGAFGCGEGSAPACRALRGGHWQSLLDRLRPRARDLEPSDAAYEDLGFRCAQSL